MDEHTKSICQGSLKDLTVCFTSLSFKKLFREHIVKLSSTKAKTQNVSKISPMWSIDCLIIGSTEWKKT